MSKARINELNRKIKQKLPYLRVLEIDNLAEEELAPDDEAFVNKAFDALDAEIERLSATDKELGLAFSNLKNMEDVENFGEIYGQALLRFASGKPYIDWLKLSCLN